MRENGSSRSGQRSTASSPSRDAFYESGNRHGMQKIKNYRTADCVVGGSRYNEGKKTVGSLLLGLYDDRRLLNHVGFTSSPMHTGSGAAEENRSHEVAEVAGRSEKLA